MMRDYEMNKYFDYYQLLNRWLIIMNEGKRVSDYFDEENLHVIAIYGMADIGRRLCESLADSDIRVAYGIDQDVANSDAAVSEIYSPEDILPEVDAVVITPFHSFDAINRKLSLQLPETRMISIEEVIFSL